MSQSAHEPAGRTRISVVIAFGRRWVLPALPEISARYPELTIDVDLDNRPVDLVAQGFDIGIRGGQIEDSSFIARRVCALPVVLVASPAYLRQAGVTTSAEELVAHRCAAVRFARGQAPVWRFLRPRGRAIEFTPQPALTTNDPETLIDLAVADAGIVQAGLHHALPHLRRGTLNLLMPGVHDPGRREIVVHYSHRQYLAPRVRMVVDALLAHFKAAADLHLAVADVLAEVAECVATAAPPSRRRAARDDPRSERRDP